MRPLEIECQYHLDFPASRRRQSPFSGGLPIPSMAYPRTGLSSQFTPISFAFVDVISPYWLPPCVAMPRHNRQCMNVLVDSFTYHWTAIKLNLTNKLATIRIRSDNQIYNLPASRCHLDLYYLFLACTEKSSLRLWNTLALSIRRNNNLDTLKHALMCLYYKYLIQTFCIKLCQYPQIPLWL